MCGPVHDPLFPAPERKLGYLRKLGCLVADLRRVGCMCIHAVGRPENEAALGGRASCRALDRLAAALSEERVTIEDIIEPYLMQEGYVQRTPRGRIITRSGCKCVGLPYKKEPQQGRQSQLPLTELPDGV